MEDKNYSEYLKNGYIEKLMGEAKFHTEMTMYYINRLKGVGVSQREIEELTNIQIKRDHICIFDNFEDSK